MLAHLDLPGTLKGFDFRLATIADIPALVDHYWRFFSDSTLPELGLTYDRRRMAAWLDEVIPLGVSPHVIALQGDTVVGSLNWLMDSSFTEKPYASLDKFYVSRIFRLSAIGRILLRLALDTASADGAVAFRAGISSGWGNGKNLFLKSGFSECPGSVLLERKL